MSKHHITQNIRPMDPLNIHTLTQRLTQDTHTHTQDTCRSCIAGIQMWSHRAKATMS